jgi:hypothetical protein
MRELLDDAIGTAPPTAIDVDTVMARQRRIGLLRPAGAVAAALAVLAAVGGVAAVASGSGQQSGTTPAPAVTRTREPVDQIMRRQSAAINELLRANLPGATIRDLRTRGSNVEVISSAEYPGHRAGDDPMTYAALESSRGTGLFALNVYLHTGTGTTPDPSETAPPAATCAQLRSQIKDSTVECADRTGPASETIVASTISSGPTVVHRVLVWRADSLVVLTAYNYWNDWDGNQPPAVFLPQPPLTVDQLVGIGVDPRLAP